MKALLLICLLGVLIGCEFKTYSETAYVPDSIRLADADSFSFTSTPPPQATPPLQSTPGEKINTGNVMPEALIAFAETLINTPYLYGSTDPAAGFDCSGFITHVFNHFDIKVPRSSRDFEFAGTDVSLGESKPGDLILFTGTDSTIRTIGHMGIIIKADGDAIDFIHSSSGKANGVVVTPLSVYYRGRFMKVVRVFG